MEEKESERGTDPIPDSNATLPKYSTGIIHIIRSEGLNTTNSELLFVFFIMCFYFSERQNPICVRPNAAIQTSEIGLDHVADRDNSKSQIAPKVLPVSLEGPSNDLAGARDRQLRRSRGTQASPEEAR